MRVTVFGATGRTGRELLAVLREQGHTVRAICRREGALRAEPPGLEVRAVDLSRDADVSAAIEGSEAVVCAFGPSRPEDPPFCAALTRRIVEAMERLGVRRLLCVTGAMVGDYPHRRRVFEALAQFYARHEPEMARDRAEQERIIQASALDWTVVKPPRLTSGRARELVRAGEVVPVGMLAHLSRGDLARFIAEQLERPDFVRRRVVVRA